MWNLHKGEGYFPFRYWYANIEFTSTLVTIYMNEVCKAVEMMISWRQEIFTKEMKIKPINTFLVKYNETKQVKEL